MPYKEFHFDSAVFNANSSTSGLRGVGAIGTRNRRTLELNDPLRFYKFHVRDCEVPLTFCNIPRGGIVSIDVTYIGVTTQVGYEFLFPEGCYTGAQFLEKFLMLWTGTIGVPIVGGAVPLIDFVTATFDPQGQLVVTMPLLSDPAGHTNDGFVIRWPIEMNSIFAQNYTAPAYEMLTFSRVATSDYPIRLLPNYLFLHSNLMEATPYGSSSRALGGYTSKTIMSKIQLDPSYTLGQIMPWWNSSLMPELMYDGQGTEFNRIEFWFTDEAGNEIMFENTNFSLTLATIVQ